MKFRTRLETVDAIRTCDCLEAMRRDWRALPGWLQAFHALGERLDGGGDGGVLADGAALPLGEDLLQRLTGRGDLLGAQSADVQAAAGQ